ncbi:MAG: flagellar basal body-associated FliL family protein [Fimbriimonadaceae bacterium]|nr:flagellar basal body-associated FliL family protein [Fimbriimonadaceae bacterium]
MSDAAEAPKKKGKLPMILVVVALVGGGGFFAMKGKGDAKKEPEVALGEVVPLGEFLVNVRGGAFLKTDVSVHLAKEALLDEHGGGGGHGEAAEPPAFVRDAVIEVLSVQSVESILSAKGKARLKVEIAEAVNNAVHENHAEEGEGKDKEEKGHAKGKESEADVLDPTWDSQEGPVLKVYFTNFAVQP